MWLARRDLERRVVIEHDLKQASRIQKRLLPSKIETPGLEAALSFEPCRWVGGDYVDVVPVTDTRVLLSVADACGKGLQAALVASWIHTIVRTALRGELSLDAVVDAMNEHLRLFLPDSSFVTFFAIMLDTTTGDFEYVNAGHPPALVLCPENTFRALDDGSTPLGVERHHTFVARGNLGVGEAVMLYTDGWTDMPDANGVPMGFTPFTQRIMEVWNQASQSPLAELIKRASASLSRYARLGGNYADDRTLLVARRRT